MIENPNFTKIADDITRPAIMQLIKYLFNNKISTASTVNFLYSQLTVPMSNTYKNGTDEELTPKTLFGEEFESKDKNFKIDLDKAIKAIYDKAKELVGFTNAKAYTELKKFGILGNALASKLFAETDDKELFTPRSVVVDKFSATKIIIEWYYSKHEEYSELKDNRPRFIDYRERDDR